MHRLIERVNPIPCCSEYVWLIKYYPFPDKKEK